MNGIYVEKSGCIWVVRDEKSGKVISFGDTISNAVHNYEHIVENERIAREIGLEDFEVD